MELVLENRLDSIFSALGDPIRRKILQMLSQSTLSVGELSKPFNISLPAISRHLKVLEWAGLISQIKEGNIRKCFIRGEALKEANAWLHNYEVFWEMNLDSLVAYFEQADGLKRKKR